MDYREDVSSVIFEDWFKNKVIPKAQAEKNF